MNRRTFLRTTGAALATVRLSTGSILARDETWSIAVIGHTGRGNYGHKLDRVWLQLPETRIVAVADPDSEGLADAGERLKVRQTFSNYQAMLQEVKPDIVAVCPRHADQHHAMALAAIRNGAKGIYLEKPMCRTPAEADDLIAACLHHNTKLAVAHRNRYHPSLPSIRDFIEQDGIGKILEIRGRGKGDRRGGAEDLWVLGSHVLDLIHYLAGKPLSCSAVLKQDGRRVRAEDVKEGNEGLGPLAGNELHVRYEMTNGIIAYFDSIANDQTKGAGFGLQVIGSHGIINLQCDKDPLAYFVPGNPFEPHSGKSRLWQAFTSAGPGQPEPVPQQVADAFAHVTPARDLIAAIREDRQPLCGVTEGAMTVEMICAAFESHRQGGKAVAIPLQQRQNALELLK